MIEKLLPGTIVKMKIVKAIHENPNINVTSLIKKVNASPNFALDYINLLEKYGILKVTKIHGKKAPVRNLVFNFNSVLTFYIIALLEIEKRENLLTKYAKLKPLFEQISTQINGFALLYGSYARLSADKDSDIDLLIVDDKADKNKIREILVTFPEASLKIETRRKFISNLNKPLYRNILKEKIVIFNEIEYLKTIKYHMN